MKRAWEAILLLIVVIVIVNIFATALKPYLPLLGLVCVAILGVGLAWLIFSRRKFW
jgi:hypothetical protein